MSTRTHQPGPISNSNPSPSSSQKGLNATDLIAKSAAKCTVVQCIGASPHAAQSSMQSWYKGGIPNSGSFSLSRCSYQHCFLRELVHDELNFKIKFELKGVRSKWLKYAFELFWPPHFPACLYPLMCSYNRPVCQVLIFCDKLTFSSLPIKYKRFFFIVKSQGAAICSHKQLNLPNHRGDYV